MIWKVLGSLLLLKYGITLSQFLWLMCRLYVFPKWGFKIDLKKLGKWAVITGATDGIGKAIAKQLAKRGLNLVLISRSEEKLKSTAKEFESLGVEVKTVQFDFSKTEGYDKIQKILVNYDIGVLVNNVGISYDHPDYYLQNSDDFYESLVNINVLSLLKMTKIVLEGMVSRKRGLIVHVSSLSGLSPTPFLTVYSASKVMVNFFGQALDAEYKNQGVSSQVITPFFVATKLSKLRANGLFIPSVEAYAAQTVNAMGLSTTMMGFWSHEIINFVISLLPQSIVNREIFKSMNGLRKQWLSKQQEKRE
ncbi:very-long-chain 3-oxoacyl-CoA reductase [Hydra vulgaris]|uniref:very-long-chain 3-oxoacyl-CoA reductase n=1 Tax=Hydra vulgaris TaxID=6087 RepID=UPI001F5F0A86|nr:very-long-chain 3-oxoacyl-CoA reductase-like [Hydra vulgaris]